MNRSLPTIDIPDPAYRPLAFLKVGQLEHLEKLMAGEVFCRHLSFYKKFENRERAFHDKHEGLLAIYDSQNIRIEIDGRTKKIVLDGKSGLAGDIVVSSNLNNPAFCVHQMHLGEWSGKIFDEAELPKVNESLQMDDRLRLHGDYVLIFINFGEFGNRFGTALKRFGVEGVGRAVRYLPARYSRGHIPESLVGFVKTHEFAHEREYRFLLRSEHPLPDPFTIQIGRLDDIAVLMPFEKFLKAWRLHFPPADEVTSQL